MVPLKDRMQVFHPELPTNVQAAVELKRTPYLWNTAPQQGSTSLPVVYSRSFSIYLAHKTLHNLKYTHSPWSKAMQHPHQWAWRISPPLSRARDWQRVTLLSQNVITVVHQWSASLQYSPEEQLIVASWGSIMIQWCLPACFPIRLMLLQKQLSFGLLSVQKCLHWCTVSSSRRRWSWWSVAIITFRLLEL